MSQAKLLQTLPAEMEYRRREKHVTVDLLLNVLIHAAMLHHVNLWQGQNVEQARVVK
jgi:hypothetical protein